MIFSQASVYCLSTGGGGLSLCPGWSLSRGSLSRVGSLSRRFSVQGGLFPGESPWYPLYGKEWAVHILLECIVVLKMAIMHLNHKNVRNLFSPDEETECLTPLFYTSEPIRYMFSHSIWFQSKHWSWVWLERNVSFSSIFPKKDECSTKLDTMTLLGGESSFQWPFRWTNFLLMSVSLQLEIIDRGDS